MSSSSTSSSASSSTSSTSSTSSALSASSSASESIVKETGAMKQLREGEKYKDKGNIAFKKGDFKKASIMYARVFAYTNGLIEPNSPMTQYATGGNAGNTYIMTSEELKICHSLKAVASANLSATHDKLGNIDKSLEYCDKALALDPNSIKCLWRKGKLLIDLKRFEQAKIVLLRANELDPNNEVVKTELSRFKKEYLVWCDEGKKKLSAAFSASFNKQSTSAESSNQ